MAESEIPKPTMEKLKMVQTLDRWVSVFKTAFKGATVDIHEGAVDADALKRMSVKMPAISETVFLTRTRATSLMLRPAMSRCCPPVTM